MLGGEVLGQLDVRTWRSVGFLDFHFSFGIFFAGMFGSSFLGLNFWFTGWAQIWGCFPQAPWRPILVHKWIWAPVRALSTSFEKTCKSQTCDGCFKTGFVLAAVLGG